MQLAAHRGEGEVDAAAVSAVCEKLESLTSVQQGAPAHAATAAAQPLAPVAAVSQAQEDPGYGFFDDEPEPAAQKSEAAGPQPEDQGYGFFDETPVQKAEKEAEQGYGFFQELAAPAAEKTASATPSADAPPGVQQAAVAAPAAATANTVKRAPEKAAASSSSETSSIRVSVEKVDQLINLVGELVITQAMLAQSAQDMLGAGGEHLQSGMYQLERNTRDLQEAVMSIRMMPISFVFSRFPRLVRDLAGKLNKQVELKLVGENTELDKGLIEKISDPLTHLVRNSLDHGIESVEKRIAAGKNACGTITLKAFHQGGNVVIEVADDGGGLNRGKILSKAKERGLPVRDEMTDQEVWALIMEPGFSTADVVTDVSGRGVGMDVVKRNIAEIGGRVELDSLEGMGSRVIIRLPLTLAILDGLSVLVGNETYIVPLGAIIESLQISESDLKTVSGEGRMLHVRGEYLPLVALHEVFNTKARAERLEQGIVVIVEAEGKKTALFVDDLLGQHQVVIKSLESNFRKIKGVSGATIMGDGKVALILDVAALVVHHGMRTGG
jgi:two-component system chemotaxis sensor kinase CheA